MTGILPTLRAAQLRSESLLPAAGRRHVVPDLARRTARRSRRARPHRFSTRPVPARNQYRIDSRSPDPRPRPRARSSVSCRPMRVHAEIDLADAKPGERTFDLTSQQVRHPRDVTVVQVVPSQLHLAFDTRLDSRSRNSSPSHRHFRRRRRSKSTWRIPSRHHHRPPPARRETRCGHHRSHRRHRNPRQRRLHHQRLRLRPPGPSPQYHFHPRHRPGPETRHHFRSLRGGFASGFVAGLASELVLELVNRARIRPY